MNEARSRVKLDSRSLVRMAKKSEMKRWCFSSCKIEFFTFLNKLSKKIVGTKYFNTICSRNVSRTYAENYKSNAEINEHALLRKWHEADFFFEKICVMEQQDLDHTLNGEYWLVDSQTPSPLFYLYLRAYKIPLLFKPHVLMQDNPWRFHVRHNT